MHSRRAVEYLARFPVPDRCEVRIMHILPPLLITEQIRTVKGATRVSPSKSYEKPAWQIEEECEGQAILDGALKTLEAGGLQASSVLQRGNVATEIIEYSKANQIDLVLGGSRGMTQATSWSLGSVSRKLIHYGGSSVLLVRGIPYRS